MVVLVATRNGSVLVGGEDCKAVWIVIEEAKDGMC